MNLNQSSSSKPSSRLDRLKKSIRKATRASKEDVESLEHDSANFRDVLNLVHDGPSDVFGPLAWELLHCVLRQSSNAKTRLLALMLTNELLVRSCAFRRACLAQLRDLVQHVVLIPGLSALPEPRNAAALLHCTALAFVKKWGERFGTESATLGLTQHFLDAKLGDVGRRLMSAGGVRATQRRRHAAEREARTRRLLLAQFETVRNEMSQMSNNVGAMDAAIAQIESCAALLQQHSRTLQQQASVKAKQQNPENQKLETRPMAEDNRQQQWGLHDSEDEDEDEDEDDFGIDWSNVTSSHAQRNATAEQPQANHEHDRFDDIDDDIAEWEAIEHAADKEEAKQYVDVKMNHPNSRSSSSSSSSNNNGISAGSIIITLPQVSMAVEDDEETGLLVQALQEAANESAQTHLPLAQRWIRVLSQVDLSDPSQNVERLNRSSLMTTAINLKRRLQHVLKIACSLGVSTNGEHHDVDFFQIMETNRGFGKRNEQAAIRRTTATPNAAARTASISSAAPVAQILASVKPKKVTKKQKQKKRQFKVLDPFVSLTKKPRSK